MIQQQCDNLNEVANLLELRTFAYDVLRKVFITEPSKELIAQFQNGIMNYFPFAEENPLLKEGMADVQHYFETFNLEEDFNRLHWDYTRMFIGPFRLPVPIWESAYLNKDGLLFQEETLKVRRIYLENNLISVNHRSEADDHLGLELDFMYQLSYLAEDLLKDRNMGQLQKTINDQKYFLTEHLLKWTPLFGNKVAAHGETEFYKGMAKVLNGFLAIDKICLEEILNTLRQ